MDLTITLLTSSGTLLQAALLYGWGCIRRGIRCDHASARPERFIVFRSFLFHVAEHVQRTGTREIICGPTIGFPKGTGFQVNVRQRWPRSIAARAHSHDSR